MSVTLGLNDHQAAAEVAALAYELVQDTPLYGLLVKNDYAPEIIGLSSVCAELSDAATRAAHQLGITASREWRPAHVITSFAPLDRMPTEDDPILCLTWGQFNAKAFCNDPRPFFGARKDIAERVGGYYAPAYSADSIEFRQVTHTPPLEYPVPIHREHYWLTTTPQDLVQGDYPIGEVSRTDFSPDDWL